MEAGDVVAAGQEEEFVRKKHGAGFPLIAVACCLVRSRTHPNQLDFVTLYDSPLRKFERLLEMQLAFAPTGLRSFATAIAVWLCEKLLRHGTG